jgi:hypothetical protein
METQLILETVAKLNAKMEAIQTKMNNQAEMRSIIDEWMTDIKDARKETTTCNKAKKTVLDPEMMQSVEEHQEVPRENAIVKSVKGRKKRRRGRKSTAGRRGEPKKLTRGNCGSRRKLAVACRKVSRHATVSWRKGNSFGKM